MSAGRRREWWADAGSRGRGSILGRRLGRDRRAELSLSPGLFEMELGAIAEGRLASGVYLVRVHVREAGRTRTSVLRSVVLR